MSYASKRKLADNSIVPLGSNLFGVCTTASDTAGKVVAMSDFNVLVEGVTIHVYFANGNTASNPTLTVGSTASKAVRINGSNSGEWNGGGFYSFTYYNNEWVMNDVQDSNENTTYTFNISGHTLTITDSDGNTDTLTLPDENTTYTMSISGHTITLTPSSGTPQTVTVPDENTTYALTKVGDDIILVGSDGSRTTVKDDNDVLEYTIDAPDSGTSTNNVSQNDVANNVANGGYALAEGKETTASGEGSHAEGISTEASGNRSHAEGFHSQASGTTSHAENYFTEASGNESHAEGAQTVASGQRSHAEGSGSVASGYASHASNTHTIANSLSQTAIGQYNIADTPDPSLSNQGKHLFIIGNGTSTGGVETRRNALAVDWDGEQEIYLSVDSSADASTDATSGADKDLFNEIRTNGWYNDVISGGMMKLKKLLAEILLCPIVVDSGRDGIWRYRKWSDGNAECWGTFSKTLTHYVTVLGGYGYTSGVVNFPTNLFVSAPICNYSAEIGNAMVLTGTITTNLTETSNVYYALTHLSGSQTCSWYVHAIGRWK